MLWTGDLWISSAALYHCATATSGFHLWQFQVFNSVAERLVVVLFWLDCERFCFWPHQGLNRDLWISCPALYHCAMVTSGFHLWQFQVFNCDAEGLVVVLFWLDLWEIFFLATPGYELGTSGSLVLHSTTVPQWLLVFTSDNFRYLTVVQRDWWWYCSDWTCERFSFWPHQGLNRDLWISRPALYHCATVQTPGFHLWQFQVFNCGAEGCGGGIVLIGPVRDFLFGHTRVWTRAPLDLLSCTLPLHHSATSGFHLWQFQVFKSGAEGLVVVLFWLDLWEIFFLATPGFELGTSGSLVLHSTTVPQWLLVFTSDNFRYLTVVQRDWWWYCSDWTCERFSFWPHQGLNWGPLDL